MPCAAGRRHGVGHAPVAAVPRRRGVLLAAHGRLLRSPPPTKVDAP
ncbi:hypothetical protein SLNWT_3684 [Streptomyces albus]|uniref:Uncharacterized protein n=1 Tax=Streptomyces albus (strain ATCC 21838 / DSM 41398 / FERM P-419 / JCM 4703 / NBRC 107858) TaxID=1081613 RepID=A0A0B5EXV2_STRA4|nr:hypothetical protein SLNWT_3684 [Streptomyces albus]